MHRINLNGCAGTAMSFECRRMLRRVLYLMPRSAEVSEEDDLICVGRTKSRKLSHRLVWPTGVGAQEAEAPGRMCCSRLKSVTRIVNDQLSKWVRSGKLVFANWRGSASLNPIGCLYIFNSLFIFFLLFIFLLCFFIVLCSYLLVSSESSTADSLTVASHTTYVVCVNFRHEWQDIQFKVDFERQIFGRFFMAILFTLRVFARNLLKESRRSYILSYFHFMSDLECYELTALAAQNIIYVNSNNKHVTNTINSFKITIWFFIFPKTVFVLQIILTQQLIKTKNQSHKKYCV